jgi:nitrite reductase (NADH) small subunit
VSDRLTDRRASMLDVGAESDFPEGVIRLVSVRNRDVGVLRWRERWYAIRNVCPHLGAPLCLGALHGRLGVADDATQELVVDDRRPTLMCPWHRWEFDLDSGLSISGRERARSYRVEVRDDRVLVELGSRDAARPA